MRWSFADKDAGSANSSAIRATEDAAQRGGQRAPAAQPGFRQTLLGRPPPRAVRGKREDELARELTPEAFLEPLARLDSLRIEAFQVCNEEPRPPLSGLLG